MVPRGCSTEDRIDGDPGSLLHTGPRWGRGSPRTGIAKEEGQVQAEVRRSPRWVAAEAKRCSWGPRGVGVVENV